MATRSLFFRPSAAAEPVLLRDGALSLDACARAVRGPEHGAVVTFSGEVRGSEDGAPIAAIEYEAYSSMALKEMRRLVARAGERWGVRAVAHHRVGVVPVGEAAVVVACGAAHRPEAFAAARWLIDEIKHRVPIWKIRFAAREAA